MNRAERKGDGDQCAGAGKRPNSVSAIALGYRKVHTCRCGCSARCDRDDGPERFDDIVKAYDTNDAYFRIVATALTKMMAAGIKFARCSNGAARRSE